MPQVRLPARARCNARVERRPIVGRPEYRRSRAARTASPCRPRGSSSRSPRHPEPSGALGAPPPGSPAGSAGAPRPPRVYPPQHRWPTPESWARPGGTRPAAGGHKSPRALLTELVQRLRRPARQRCPTLRRLCPQRLHVGQVPIDRRQPVRAKPWVESASSRSARGRTIGSGAATSSSAASRRRNSGLARSWWDSRSAAVYPGHEDPVDRRVHRPRVAGWRRVVVAGGVRRSHLERVASVDQSGVRHWACTGGPVTVV